MTRTERFQPQGTPACTCVQVGASDLPVIGQIANGAVYLQSELGTAIDAFKGVYTAYEDAFCTPATYTPPAAMPANLTGIIRVIGALQILTGSAP